MLIGRCPTCASKDAHIESLKREIETLHKLLFPQPTQDVSVSDLEVDALLNGDNEPIHLNKDDEVAREADRFLSGHHDDDDQGLF